MKVKVGQLYRSKINPYFTYLVEKIEGKVITSSIKTAPQGMEYTIGSRRTHRSADIFLIAQELIYTIEGFEV